MLNATLYYTNQFFVSTHADSAIDKIYQQEILTHQSVIIYPISDPNVSDVEEIKTIYRIFSYLDR